VAIYFTILSNKILEHKKSFMVCGKSRQMSIQTHIKYTSFKIIT